MLYYDEIVRQKIVCHFTTFTFSCTPWHSRCNQDVNNGVGKLLGYINSVKGLAAIRDALWEQLGRDDQMVSWDKQCQEILCKQIAIWEDFFRPLFFERIKVRPQYSVVRDLKGGTRLFTHLSSNPLNLSRQWKGSILSSDPVVNYQLISWLSLKGLTRLFAHNFPGFGEYLCFTGKLSCFSHLFYPGCAPVSA